MSSTRFANTSSSSGTGSYERVPVAGSGSSTSFIDGLGSEVSRGVLGGSVAVTPPAPHEWASGGAHGRAGSTAAKDKMRGLPETVKIAVTEMRSYDEPVGFVPVAPPFVEKFTCFITAERPDAVFNTIQEQLKIQRADFKPKPDAFKITGVVYENNIACNFRVHIFEPRYPATATKPVNPLYLVEFQRRSGCVVAFANFFRSVCASLGPRIVRWTYDAFLASLKPGGTSLEHMHPPAFAEAASAAPILMEHEMHRGVGKSKTGSGDVGLPPLSVAMSSAGISLDDHTTACLVDMAAAKDLDIQREAIRSLATASENTENIQKLVDWEHQNVKKEEKQKSNQIDLPPYNGQAPSGSRIVDMLGVLVGSSDGEVARSAAILIVNIASRFPRLSSILFALLAVLETPLPTASARQLIAAEVRRRVSLAFLTIATSKSVVILEAQKGEFITKITSIIHGTPSLDDQVRASLEAARTALVPTSHAHSASSTGNGAALTDIAVS